MSALLLHITYQNVSIFTSVVVVGSVMVVAALAVASLVVFRWWGRSTTTLETRARVRSLSLSLSLSLPGLVGPLRGTELHDSDSDRQPQPQPQLPLSKVPQAVLSQQSQSSHSLPFMTQELPHAYPVGDATVRFTYTNDQ